MTTPALQAEFDRLYPDRRAAALTAAARNTVHQFPTSCEIILKGLTSDSESARKIEKNTLGFVANYFIARFRFYMCFPKDTING